MFRGRFNLVHVVSCRASRHLRFLVDAADPVQRDAAARQSRLPAPRSANSVSSFSSQNSENENLPRSGYFRLWRVNRSFWAFKRSLACVQFPPIFE